MSDVAAHDQTSSHRYLVHSTLEGSPPILHVAGETEASSTVAPIGMTHRHGQGRVVGSQRSAMLGVVRSHARNQLQVLKTVVELVAIPMVHDRTRRDRSIRLFPHPAVLMDAPATRESEPHIAGGVDRAMTPSRALKLSLISVEA